MLWKRAKSLTPPPQQHSGSEGAAAPQGDMTVGWQVATFALERLEPAPTYTAGSSAVWGAYTKWCKSRHAVPLAFAVFYDEFEKVAKAVGIPRTQNGAHVIYGDVRILSGTDK